MKKIGSALALVLLLTACEPGAPIERWDETLNPWMNTAGWAVQEYPDDNSYVIRKNGVDMWRRAIYCSRGCTGEYFALPEELRYAAEQQFIADLEAAQDAYLEVISEKTGIVPIDRPEPKSENTSIWETTE